MTDITELALRLKLEAHRAVSNFNPQMNIKTRDLKELVEALERKEEQRANWFQMAQKLGEDLDSADKRIAELESRTVKLSLSFTQSVILSGRRTTALPISPCSSFSRSVKLSEATSTRLAEFAGYGMVKRSAS
ncbi:hypothetical protein GR306_02465 [Klebsiella pneumoniae]|nr:hypothetical protein GR306_02465 [Klebsiella pneumoniae]